LSHISVEVETKVEEFKNAGEDVEIYKTPISYEGAIYHYATYKKKNKVLGQIVVTADGKVLPLEQIKEVLLIAFEVNSMATVILGEFKKWRKAPTKLLKRQLWVLNSVEKSFDMPDDIRKSFAQFKSVPTILLEEQLKLVQAVQDGIDYNNNILEITADTAIRMREYLRRIMGSKNKQQVSMVVTYEDRKKVLEYLKGQVSIFQLNKWMHYNDMLAQHRAFLVSPEDILAYEEGKGDICGEIANIEVFKGTMKSNRNPKM